MVNGELEYYEAELGAEAVRGECPSSKLEGMRRRDLDFVMIGVCRIILRTVFRHAFSLLKLPSARNYLQTCVVEVF